MNSFYKSASEKLVPIATSFFELSAKDIDGNLFQFSSLKKHGAFLIVNVASYCGFTKPNYASLNEVYAKYSSLGLEILGFPCNQFANQENICNVDIKELVVKTYGVKFPLFEKIEVNGENTHDVFKYLRVNSELHDEKEGTKEIPWNFSVFLVDREGKVRGFYPPHVKPTSLGEEIEKLLN